MRCVRKWRTNWEGREYKGQCKRDALPGRPVCQQHADWHLAATRRLTARRREQKLCQWCGKKPALTRNYCEEHQAVRRGQKHAVKLALVKMLGGRCEFCGNDDPGVLSVDHMRRDNKAHRKALGLTARSDSVAFYRRLLALGLSHAEEWQLALLCFNCHFKKDHSAIHYRPAGQASEALGSDLDHAD